MGGTNRGNQECPENDRIGRISLQDCVEGGSKLAPHNGTAHSSMDCGLGCTYTDLVASILLFGNGVM